MDVCESSIMTIMSFDMHHEPGTGAKESKRERERLSSSCIDSIALTKCAWFSGVSVDVLLTKLSHNQIKTKIEWTRTGIGIATGQVKNH